MTRPLMLVPTDAEIAAALDFSGCTEADARGIDRIFDTADRLLLAGDYVRASRMLDDARRAVDRIPMSALLSLLTITFPWQAALGRARKDLLVAARSRAVRQQGETKAARLFSGLDDD